VISTTVCPTDVSTLNNSALSLNPNEEKEYKLIVLFKETNLNQDDNKGKLFQAKIQVNEYKSSIQSITIHPNNNSEDYTVGKYLGLPIGQINEPTKNDRVFMGWYSDSEFTSPISANTITEKSLTDIYARYGLTVTFNGTGGTLDTTEMHIFENSTIETFPTGTYPGKDLDGWYDDYGNAYDSQTVIRNNITLYAYWQPHKE